MPRYRKGDLVTLLPHGVDVDRWRLAIGKNIIGVVLQCRYKSDAYLFQPANADWKPYWIEGRYLLPYGD